MDTKRQLLYNTIKSNLEELKTRIEKACLRAKRTPQEIEIVGATKTVPPETINIAIEAGLKIIGENRVQEAQEKYPYIGPKVKWHLIGHLQTNKIKKALEIFDLIQSLDSLHLAKEINKRAQVFDKVVPVLIEVNTSGEATKFGIKPDELLELVEAIMKFPHLKVMGLMTLGPGLAVEDPEKSRPCFRLLYELKIRLEKKLGIFLPYLSMGMSADFEIGIEEGATMVRIGTLLFGKRVYNKEQK
jgi:pyridoxal phosphate enzyme (YggS family)